MLKLDLMDKLIETVLPIGAGLSKLNLTGLIV